jgi:hypothetical protein
MPPRKALWASSAAITIWICWWCSAACLTRAVIRAILMSRSGFGPGGDVHDTVRLIEDLYRLTGSERVDLMVLNRAAPLARERALTTGEPLFQRHPGGFANAQIAAIMERFDTDRFRAMELELMTSEPPASSTPSGS